MLEVLFALIMLLFVTALFLGGVSIIVYIILSICNFISEYFRATAKADWGVIAFDEFLNYYTLNPDRWDLEDNYVCYEYIEVYYGRPHSRSHIFRFSFIDYIRYNIWLYKRKKQKEKDRNLEMKLKVQEDYAAFLDEIQKDMEGKNER